MLRRRTHPIGTLELNFTGAEQGKTVCSSDPEQNKLNYPFPADARGINFEPMVTRAKMVIPGAFRKVRQK